jgi:ATP-dependent DNA helicase RecG
VHDASSSTPDRDWPACLAALTRPLDFAARDDYAHVDRVRGLDDSVSRACEALRALAIPPDVRDLFAELAEGFRVRCTDEGIPAAVAEALERIAPLRAPGWAESVLARPTSVLPGVGPRRAESLSRRGLRTVGDLLFHLPARYEDRRTLERVDGLRVGQRATFVADVLLVDFVSSRAGGRPRRILQAVVGDGSGTLNLKWFRGAETIARGLEKGQKLLVTGDVKRYRFSKEIVHPEIERIDDEEGAGSAAVRDSLRRVVPRYTAPEGVNPRTLRRLIRLAVADYADLVAGHLPERLVRAQGLPPAATAIRLLHAPDPDADVEAYTARASAAHRRLVLEELYLLEVGLARRRAAEAALPGIRLSIEAPRIDAAEAALPFVLTGAQQRAWSEIRADLGRSAPMHRLLQGDVGSGKTVVALLAAVAAAASGRQAALMAPTELLAEQHARTLEKLCAGGGEPLALRIGLLTASRPAAANGAVRAALAAGDLDLVVGTHALVQDDVAFHGLALAIVDEQHRFGVRQRAALARRGADGRVPHTLVMTATPIPRTLALTVYGDLDVSVIDGLPPGRRPVETLVVRAGEGAQVAELVRETVARGEQVYVVYPLVEESEKVDLRSALESAERIRAAFPDAETGVVHGRLDAGQRAAVMDRFAAGAVQILVSTTVIEVGVDVPNATLMVVEHAERFGLAQLHQLRGRVGRGERPGTCVLVARGGGEKGEARLRAMLETTDGFAIADADLAIRGPGEFLGTRQSGHLPDLRIADLVRDARLVSLAREAALATVRADPRLHGQPGLARAVAGRWGERLALADVG